MNKKQKKAALNGFNSLMVMHNVYVHVDLRGVRRLGKVIGVINQKTMWVKVMKGAKTYDVIKRHNVKHNVIVAAVVPIIPEAEYLGGENVFCK